MALFTTLEAIPMGCFLDYRKKMFAENQAPVYSSIYLHAYFSFLKKTCISIFICYAFNTLVGLESLFPVIKRIKLLLLGIYFKYLHIWLN